MAAELKAIERKRDPEVVTFLEEALARALAGDTNGVLILEQNGADVTYACAGLKDRMALVGWLFHAMHRLQDEPKAGEATEICESEWRTAIEMTRIASYQAGLAEGELRGRVTLADEIEAEFAAKPITADDATRIRLRQIH